MNLVTDTRTRKPPLRRKRIISATRLNTVFVLSICMSEAIGYDILPLSQGHKAIFGTDCQNVRIQNASNPTPFCGSRGSK